MNLRRLSLPLVIATALIPATASAQICPTGYELWQNLCVPRTAASPTRPAPAVPVSPQAPQNEATTSAASVFPSALEAAPRQRPTAAHGAMPLIHADRPLTLRQGVFTTNVLGLLTVPTNDRSSFFGTHLGLAYGVANFLEVDATPAIVQWAPDVSYLAPRFGVTVRFWPSSFVEMGFRTAVRVPTNGGSVSQDFVIPLRFHIAHAVRFDVRPQFRLSYDGNVERATMWVPFAFSFNMGPYVHAALEAELVAATDHVDDGVLQLWAELGVSIPYSDGRPAADLVLRGSPGQVAFSSASGEGPGGGGASFSADTLAFELQARIYFHLLGGAAP